MDQTKVEDVIIVDVKLRYYSTAGTDGIDHGKSSSSVYNVNISAGMTSSSFDVDIIDNMIQDGDKMFTITITGVISSCLTLPVTVDSKDATVTIEDDEGMTIELAQYLHNQDHSDRNRVFI